MGCARRARGRGGAAGWAVSAADVINGAARWHVEHGESLAWLRTLPDASVDAVVTDPPAGIAFMGKAWDGDRGGRAQWIAWLAEIMAECRRALKSGAHALVWALPRTSHWTATACEDAGLRVVDVGVHLFGGGWPKARGLLKPAAEHWIVCRNGKWSSLQTEACRIDAQGGRPLVTPTGTAGSVNSYAARVSGGTTAGGATTTLGRWPANVTLEHEPECRLVGTKRVRGSHDGGKEIRRSLPPGYRGGDASETVGAAFANADGTETIEAWECAAGCAVAALDTQGGDRQSGGTAVRRTRADSLSHNAYGSESRGVGEVFNGYGDSGGASRFFYCAKARGDEARGRGNTHPTVKPVDLMRWLCRLVTPPRGIVLDPFTGSGTTGVAAMAEGLRFIGAEREAEYIEIARSRILRAQHEHPEQGSLFREVGT